MPKGGARYTERECPDCGARFTRRSDKPTGRCIDCAKLHFASVARQEHTKSGPVWEKITRGQLAYWTAEADRLGLPH